MTIQLGSPDCLRTFPTAALLDGECAKWIYNKAPSMFIKTLHWPGGKTDCSSSGKTFDTLPSRYSP
jgi:hypothetical protein